MIDLAGCSAIVTGGSGAIGGAVAERLVAAGAAVVLADVDAPRGVATAERIGASFVRTDVGLSGDLASAVAAATELGPLRFAFLNAGVSSTEPFDATDDSLYRRAVSVNLDGVYWGVRATVPALRTAGGGAIVVTSSLAGLVPQPADPIYSATKSAVIALVRALGPTLRDDGIRVNCVCPGFVDTPMVPAAVRDSGFPLLTTSDVADAVLAIAAMECDSQAFVLQPGRELSPYRFHGVPGARAPGAESAVAPGAEWA